MAESPPDVFGSEVIKHAQLRNKIIMLDSKNCKCHNTCNALRIAMTNILYLLFENFGRFFKATRPRGYITFFLCSSKLGMKFSLLINMKMPIIAGIFILMSRESFMLKCI